MTGPVRERGLEPLILDQGDASGHVVRGRAYVPFWLRPGRRVAVLSREENEKVKDDGRKGAAFVIEGEGPTGRWPHEVTCAPAWPSASGSPYQGRNRLSPCMEPECGCKAQPEPVKVAACC